MATGQSAAWGRALRGANRLMMLATGLALGACGGGGGSGEPAPPAPVEPEAELELVFSAAADSLPSGSVQTQTLQLRNRGKAGAGGIVLSVLADAKVLQLPLSCAALLNERCKPRADGGLDIGELAAGASIEIRQPLRVRSGFSGELSNQWSVSRSGSATPLTSRQVLRAYAADVSVSIALSQSGTESGETVLNYPVTLSNAGPDDARNVDWLQRPSGGMRWLGATCTAMGGASCPAKLAEQVQVERLPKGGELRVVHRYAASESVTSMGGFLASSVGALGDPRPANDAALLPTARANGDAYLAMALDGQTYRMEYAFVAEGGFHISGNGIDLRDALFVDVTNDVFIGRWNDPTNLLKAGTLQLGRGIAAGAYDLGTGRRPFIASNRFVNDLAELDGQAFTVLGSKADRDGNPIDAFVWTAQFQANTLLLCTTDNPVPVGQCVATALKRFDVALVGTELELVSGQDVSRLRAARTDDGVVLILAQRNSNDGSSQLWVGVPTQAVTFDTRFRDYSGFSEGTLGSATGRAAPVFPEYDPFWTAHGLAISSGGLPENLNRYRDITGQGPCDISGELANTLLPGLLKGNVKAGFNGRLCYEGPVFHIQTRGLAVLLGAKDGPLMGRWVFSVAQ